MKPILLSGMRPTGRLHLGNYLGALKNFVDLQNSNKYNCHFFIADLHSLNTNFNPKTKKQETLEVLAAYLAAGLNPKKSTLYIQSKIPAHSELAIILNNLTYFGELSRMTQFKDLSQQQPENINAGLFTYPSLMAADIIIYDAKYVPVGDDQLQHLEFTRELARRFNNRFGKTFIEPQPLLTKTPRLMSLDNPQKKMSKSLPKGCLFLDDVPTEIKNKIMTTATDSGKEIKYQLKNKPGISNLLEIYSSLSGKTINQLEKEFKGRGYSDFKKSLAEVVANYFANFRQKKTALLKNKKSLETIASNGAQKAQAIANKKLATVHSALGLI